MPDRSRTAHRSLLAKAADRVLYTRLASIVAVASAFIFAHESAVVDISRFAGRGLRQVPIVLVQLEKYTFGHPFLSSRKYLLATSVLQLIKTHAALAMTLRTIISLISLFFAALAARSCESLRQQQHAQLKGSQAAHTPMQV